MKKLSPRETKTFKQLCSLKTDNTESKESWILVDVGTVHIHNQKNGEHSTGEVTLSRKEFNKFVDWYNKKQKVSA